MKNKVAIFMLFGQSNAVGHDTPMKEEDPSGEHVRNMEYINDVFRQLAAEDAAISVFDPLLAPHYDPNAWDKNLFRWDLIHYTGQTNSWVAEEILKEYKERKR